MFTSHQAHQAVWLGNAVHDCIEMYVGFIVRFLALKKFPFILLWFIFRPPDVECRDRRAMAKDLMTQTAEEIGDPTTLKIRKLFPKTVRDIAASGRVANLDFYMLIVDTNAMWMADNQEIEGVASMIKHLTDIAPHMEWGLLSSRITIKKAMAQCPSTKASRDQFVSDCEAYYNFGQEAWIVIRE